MPLNAFARSTHLAHSSPSASAQPSSKENSKAKRTDRPGSTSIQQGNTRSTATQSAISATPAHTHRPQKAQATPLTPNVSPKYVQHFAPLYPTIGQQQARYRVLLFIDPYCDLCHESVRQCEEFAKTHSDICFVIHIYPIGGSDSFQAARALLHAHTSGHFFTLQAHLWEHFIHNELPPDDKALKSIITKHLSGNPDTFFKGMQTPSITGAIRSTLHAVKTFGVLGTPAFVYIAHPPTHHNTAYKAYEKIDGQIPPNELLELLHKNFPNG